MDNREIYTITIVRNIGVPISFTIKRWKILFFLGLSLAFLSFLLYESYQYLRTVSESERLSTQLVEAESVIVKMKSQIAEQDNSKYKAVQQNKATENDSPIKSALLNQPEFSTEGIWVTNKSTLDIKELQAETALEVSKLKTDVKGDDLFLTVQLKNNAEILATVGGYLCITLVNNDVVPTRYKSATGGTLGDRGFPSTYLAGKEYYISKKRRTRTYKLNKVKLVDMNEYYTDAVAFVFSYKGRLLNKQFIPLDKKIFLE